MWELNWPKLDEPLDLSFFTQEQREIYDKFKEDAPNLSGDEFDRRQKEVLDIIIGPQEPERPDLMNGWIETDGTFHRLLTPNRHEMWSWEKFGMRHRELMFRGWVKVTQWDRMDKPIAMYTEELTIDQEEKMKELNAKPSSVSRFYK